MASIAEQLQSLGLAPSEPQEQSSKRSLAERLRAFDWSWEYSDQFLANAAQEQRRLQRILRQKECPFPWEMLRSWACSMIFEDFEEVTPGDYCRRSGDKRGIAPCSRQDLITGETKIEIDAWLAKN